MNFLKKLLSWVTSIIIAAVVLSVIVLHIPQFFGMTPSVISTYNMQPDCSYGSVVFALETEPEQIEYGDIISFYYGNDREILTNKVVDINFNEKYYTVEESSNASENTQKQVPYDDLIGRVKFYMPFIGYVSIALKTMMGKIMLGVVIVLAIISFFIPEKNKDWDEC